MSENKHKRTNNKEVKNKLNPIEMEEKAEAIEFHLINKDIWKDFVKEPNQNKSSCYLTSIEINIVDVKAKSYFFTAKIEYEIFDVVKRVEKTGKAVLKNENKVRSVVPAAILETQ